MVWRLQQEEGYQRSFLPGYKYATPYECWEIRKGCGKVPQYLNFWYITKDSYLSKFLKTLLGGKDYFSINEHQLKILTAMFDHTEKWRIFRDATQVLKSKGSNEAFKFLEKKFLVIILGDKLDGT